MINETLPVNYRSVLLDWKTIPFKNISLKVENVAKNRVKFPV